MVDARDAYPQTDQKNVRIRPGYDNLVAVDATSVVASEDIKSVDPKERNCYFGDEVELKAHLYYTQVRIEKKIPPKKSNGSSALLFVHRPAASWSAGSTTCKNCF